MTATVTLDICEFLPLGFNFDGFSFNFKTDGYDEVIEYAKRNQILAQITNLKKDRKFTVRVLKNGSLVGITEVVLPQMMLLKREENYQKQLSISMTDTIKKSIMGKETKPMQIVIKALIEYKEDPNNTGNNGPRSSSAKPISSLNGLTGSANKNSSGKKNSTTNNITTSGQKNTNTTINTRGSLYAVKDKNQKPEMIEIDEFGEVDKSFLDSIFGDEHIPDFDQVDKALNEFIQEFNNQSKESLDTTDPTQLKEKSKILIPKLFDLQKLYYSQFNKAIKTNRRLKEILIKYNEKYRTIVKKSNRLKEALESNLIRSELTAFINKEENKRINDALSINRTELDIFKHIFGIEYKSYDLAKFQEEKKLHSEDQEKKLLLKAFENLCRNQNLMSKIPEDKKIQLSYLTAKYGINTQPDDGRIIEEKVEEEVQNNQIELDGGEDGEDGDGLEVRQSVGENMPAKKLSILKSTVGDTTDKKIDDFLVDFYNKKRLTQISFKRLSEGEYEFGSQKVAIKVEGEAVKVKVGNGFINFDKYIEVNTPLEEAKMLKTQSMTDKLKVGGKNSVVSTKSGSAEKKRPTKK